MFEEVAVASELLIVVPAVVAGVAALVLLVFWIGSGRQRSFEEEKALALKRADEALKEREKVQQGGKKKKSFVRRKLAARGSGGEEEEQPTAGGKGTESPDPALKPILKGSGAKPPLAAAAAAIPATTRASPGRTPLKVDFQLEEEMKKTPQPTEKKASFMRIDTPHPSVMKQKAAIARRLMGEREDDDLGGEPVVIQDESPPLDEKPKSKPSPGQPATPKAPPSTTRSSSATGGQKRRPKQKHSAEHDPSEGLPLSRIVEIVGASPMSDEGIEQLIEQLLEKMNANSEWQAANMRSDSVKSLKKANQELLARCGEAENTVKAHSSKIRELRTAITLERTRHQSSDGALQAKISQQSDELSIARTKISGLEEDVKHLKVCSAAQTMQQLEEKNASLQQQMATCTQQNSSLESQLLVTSDQAKQLQDTCNTLETDLRRAKEALKPSADVKSLTDRISDLEGILAGTERENEDLQAAMQACNEEKAKIASDMKALASSKEGEREGLSKEIDELQSLLRQAEDKVAQLSTELESRGDAGAGRVAEENAQLQGRVTALETENASLRPMVDSLVQKEAEVEQLRGQLEADRPDTSLPQAELEAKWEEELARVKSDYENTASDRQTQHDAELQALRESLSQAEGLFSERQKEADELRGKLKEQEEKMSPLELQVEQLTEQLSTKKDVETELEKLRQVSNGPQAENGVPSEEGGEKQPSVLMEVYQEELRGKEEEVSQMRQENEELAQQLKQLESKLEELKSKNNDLRDKCWKARDEAAITEKAFEQKLQQAYKEAEKRSKVAKAEVQEEAQDAQRSLLQRLFPELSVDAKEFSLWLDDFETQALDVLQQARGKISSLESSIQDLRDNELRSLKETEQLRETLQATMASLSQLQSEVETESESHQRKFEERDEMLEREKQANRGLQEELRKERDRGSQLQKELQETKQEATEAEELKCRLKDLEHQYQLAESEVETLRHSLHHELEIKETTEHKIDELEEHDTEVEERMHEVSHKKEEMERKYQELSDEAQHLRDKLKEMEKKLQAQQLEQKIEPHPIAVSTEV